LREAAPKFRERGARIVMVGQGPADAMDEFCASHGVSDAFVCLTDPERTAYDAFGLTRRGDLGDVMGPRVLAAGIKALRYGVSLPGKGQDIRQLGGAFVIDREGGIRLAQRAATSADRATVDSLLAALP
jgi:AhpC/TSA antioxidant enzyme